MKIKKIELKDFNQFKDLTIDLTYPEGHPKAGEPLDKVCIIGQSGTGKTTLLNVAAGLTYLGDDFYEKYGIRHGVSVTQKFEDFQMDIRLLRHPTNKEVPYIHELKNCTFNGKIISFEEIRRECIRYIESIDRRVIFYPADLDYEGDADVPSLITERYVDFRLDDVGSVWSMVFSEIQKYQEEELKLKQDISNVAINRGDINRIKEAVQKLEEWKSGTFNPITILADECLDKILQFLKLRVSQQDFTFYSKQDIGAVKLEDFRGNIVPYDLLSTGTKQIVLTAISLFYLKPNKTIILCDEPERSLYPSIQKFIVDYYVSLTTDSQFFFATHSPIIASSFEPWEIVELKFNDDGYVFQEQYYEGERHVDNYTIIPSYLTYDQMLSKVFDMDETHSHDRSEKIAEVLMLRNRLEKMRDKGEMDTPKAQETYAKYKDLAGKLFWDFELQ